MKCRDRYSDLINFITALWWVSVTSISLSSGSFAQEYVWDQFFCDSHIQALTTENDLIWIGLYRNGIVKYNYVTSEKEYFNSSNLPITLAWIQDIIIDKNGFKWIASNGVVKYDGNTWLKYTPDNSGLMSDQVYALAIDALNNLWIGTYYGGLTKFDGQNWITYNKNNSQLPSNDILSIDIDSLQNIWLGTNNGLVKFNQDSIIVFNTSNSGLSHNRINSIKIDQTGVLWIGLQNNATSGLCSFDGSVWQSYPASYIKSNSVQIIHIDDKNVKWFGNLEGVTSFDGLIWKNYNNSNSGLKSQNIKAITSDKNNRTWIGSADITLSILKIGGLNSFDGQNWETHNVSNSGLSHNRLTAIAVDTNSSNIWVGTLSGDLVKFSGVHWNKITLPENRDGYNLSAPVIMNAIVVDKYHSVWIGAWFDGLYKIVGTTIQKYSAATSPLKSNTIYDLCLEDNLLWIANESNLITLNINNGNWIIYNTENFGLPFCFIKAITIDKLGIKWVATSVGLIKYDGTQWSLFNTNNSPLPTNTLTAISTDKDNNVWIGTEYHGVVRYNGDQWILYNVLNSDLASNAIKKIKTDYNNNVWIASLLDFNSGIGGINRYHDGQWEKFTYQNSGISDVDITDIAFDTYGKKWITSEHGGLIVYNLGDTLKPDTSGNIIPIKLPEEFSLHQNYPNPFNSNTLIGYSVPKQEMIEIMIFDVLGREIIKLVDEVKEAGEYQLEINAEKFTSGIYLYRMVASQFSQTKKMVLIK